MKQAEFALLLKTGCVDTILIDASRHLEGAWTISAISDDDNLHPVPTHLLNWIEPAREKTQRTWASLDTAYAWVLIMGWHGPVTIGG